jgi:iron complex transport system ATP-binding protein
MKVNITITSFNYSSQQSTNFENTNLNWNIGNQGRCIGVCGPNGSGKTTFLKCISGLLKYNGETIVDGENLTLLESKKRAQFIAYTPSIIHSNVDLPIAEFFLQSFYAYSDFTDKEKFLKIETLLQEFEAIHLIKKSLNELSAGQMQLILFLRALLQNPKIFIFDETFSNIDFKTQSKVFKKLLELNQKGHFVFFSSHDINAILQFSDEILWFENQSLEFQSPTQDLLKDEKFLAKFNDIPNLRIQANSEKTRPQIFWGK